MANGSIRPDPRIPYRHFEKCSGAAGLRFRLRYETGMRTPIFDRLRLPVNGSPLFIISGPDLVIAQCKAGIVGSFPALNARPQSLLDEWLHRITEELAAWNRDNPDRPAAPYAVNQIVHKSNDRLEADLA